MLKKYLSWSIEAEYLVGKKVKKDNLTVDFGLDEKLCKLIEDKISELEKMERSAYVMESRAQLSRLVEPE